MIDIATLYESLQAADIPVVGVAYYPDPELRHQHVPAAPAWWYVAEDYAVRVDTSRAPTLDDVALMSAAIEGIA
jgi:hypothetical protein